MLIFPPQITHILSVLHKLNSTGKIKLPNDQGKETTEKLSTIMNSWTNGVHHLLVDVVEVFCHVPRPHRRVLATLAPVGWIVISVFCTI